jgi:aminoglycoside phosphotransferase (APT) family kinase protein
MNDHTIPMRKGESIDAQRIRELLQAQGIAVEGDLQITQYPGGFSNLTYLLKDARKAWVLRRPPVGANIQSAHDMGREFRVLSLLKPHYPRVPGPILYHEDPDLIGAPFYIMEKVNGLILRNKIPADVELGPGQMRALSETAIRNLAHLHTLDVASTGLEALGKPEGYTQRQTLGWIKRYQQSATDSIADMEALADWMAQHIPTPQRTSFLHNDYKFDNLVLDLSKEDPIVAVLDWEMSTVGDPLMDLGTTLGYWAEPGDPDVLKQFNLSWLPGNLNRESLVRYYEETTQIPVHDLLFYYVYGVFKVAVIAQQIYARFTKGLTQDPRFGMLIYVVKACAAKGAEALATGRISQAGK